MFFLRKYEKQFQKALVLGLVILSTGFLIQYLYLGTVAPRRWALFPVLIVIFSSFFQHFNSVFVHKKVFAHYGYIYHYKNPKVFYFVSVIYSVAYVILFLFLMWSAYNHFNLIKT